MTFLQSKEKHKFHILDTSPLPLYTVMSILQFILITVFYWNSGSLDLGKNLDHINLEISLFFWFLCLLCWISKIVYESGEGHHTAMVQNGLRTGMILFIISEIMFFFAFFWAFLHVSLAPSIEIGCKWPPQGSQHLDIFGIPLANTILLLSSGITITVAHNIIIKMFNFNTMQIFIQHLGVTIKLGAIFLICQWIEYKIGTNFSWKNSLFGSIFFITTGFHGFHVTIGALFLIYCLIRILITNSTSNVLFNSIQYKFLKIGKYSFSKEQHLGFETGAWYWHFVDIIWILLFILVYWWETN